MFALYLSSILGSLGTRGKQVGKGDTSETSWYPRIQTSTVLSEAYPSMGRTFVARTPSCTRPYSTTLTLRNTSGEGFALTCRVAWRRPEKDDLLWGILCSWPYNVPEWVLCCETNVGGLNVNCTSSLEAGVQDREVVGGK